jgi:hypothetical protein
LRRKLFADEEPDYPEPNRPVKSIEHTIIIIDSDEDWCKINRIIMLSTIVFYQILITIVVWNIRPILKHEQP